MAGSALVAVKKAIVTGLTAAISDSNVSVTYGYQGGDETVRRDQIFMDRARVTHDPAALKTGRNFRNETAEFDVVILSAGVGIKQDACDTRAFALGQLVEEFIADRKGGETLNVTGLNWIRVTGFDHTPLNAPNGCLAEIRYHVRYDARLT